MVPIITEEKDSHFYKLDGTPQFGATLREARKENLLPSVTTIMKQTLAQPQLERWKIEQAILASLTLPKKPEEDESAFVKRIVEDYQSIAKNAATFGKKVHDSAEIYNIHGKLAVEDESVRPFAEKYIAWYKDNVEEVLCAEKVILNHKVGYAGRMDMCFRHKNKKVYIADIKTQKYGVKAKPTFYPTWGMQLAAYKNNENLDMKVDGVLSIVLNSKEPTDVATEEWKGVPDYFKAFTKLTEVWQWMKKYKPETK